MKSKLAKLATALIVGIASFNAAVATAASAPPCPKFGIGKVPVLNDVFRNPAGGGWIVASSPIGSEWGSLFVTVFDTDVYDEQMAFQRGQQILNSIAMQPLPVQAVELKGYNADGSHYYACYFPISVDYVGFGDYLGVVSVDYSPAGNVSNAKVSGAKVSGAEVNAYPDFDKFVRARR